MNKQTKNNPAILELDL